MKTIIRSRDSGKAKEILQFAREHEAAVVTKNKRAFAVKAESLGFKDVEILDYQDLNNDDYSFLTPVVVHNADKYVEWAFKRDYGLQVIGLTATKGDK